MKATADEIAIAASENLRDLLSAYGERHQVVLAYVRQLEAVIATARKFVSQVYPAFNEPQPFHPDGPAGHPITWDVEPEGVACRELIDAVGRLDYGDDWPGTMKK